MTKDKYYVLCPPFNLCDRRRILCSKPIAKSVWQKTNKMSWAYCQFFFQYCVTKRQILRLKPTAKFVWQKTNNTSKSTATFVGENDEYYVLSPLSNLCERDNIISCAHCKICLTNVPAAKFVWQKTYVLSAPLNSCDKRQILHLSSRLILWRE